MKGADVKAQEVTCKEKTCTTDACLPDNSSNNVYFTRFIYSSKVNPRQVDALMAKKSKNVKNCKHVSQSVQGRVIWGKNPKVPTVCDNEQACEIKVVDLHKKMLSCKNVRGGFSPTSDKVNEVTSVNSMDVMNTDTGVKVMVEVKKSPTVESKTANESDRRIGDALPANVISVQGKGLNSQDMPQRHNDARGSVNDAKGPDLEFTPIFDINYTGIEDKFANSILHVHQFNKSSISDVNTAIHKKWRDQSQFNFGFVPLDEQIMPDKCRANMASDIPLLQLHHLVRQSGVPNYMGVRIPVKSQLNVNVWKQELAQYWDQQVLHLIEFGFPLDFNRNCPLRSEKGNHKSATQFPADINAYIQEETKFDAILGPFKEKPIPLGHSSPFMTRPKPNSSRRRVIVDLSWPLGASVNAGIDKNSYLDSEFVLTFPTVDDITNELVKLGRGAHIYKVDVSRAFRHVKVDPGDFDLLGLEWEGHYVDTCVPFGTRHRSQIFQRLSDGVRYIMRQKGFTIIDYIDDYVGMGVPSVASASYATLTDLMARLGLSISQNKLVPPSTQVTCLGVLIDTVHGTISIPPEKVHTWLSKDVASKRQLQSILGLLLYVHKCVRPARFFLNRMLDLLRSAHMRQQVSLTPDFKRDLRWFAKFLPQYNGTSLYDHRPVDVTVEIDACLTGFGGRSGDLVYHLPIVRGYRNWTIVHLEMVNILLALRLFHRQWSSRKVLIQCDNEAVVSVLKTGKTRDPYLGACARNIWYLAAGNDTDLRYVHIQGVNNVVADILSRWQGSPQQWQVLHRYIAKPIWLNVSHELLDIDPEL